MFKGFGIQTPPCDLQSKALRSARLVRSVC